MKNALGYKFEKKKKDAQASEEKEGSPQADAPWSHLGANGGGPLKGGRKFSSKLAQGEESFYDKTSTVNQKRPNRNSMNVQNANRKPQN